MSATKEISLTAACQRLKRGYHLTRDLVLRGELEGRQTQRGRWVVSVDSLDAYLTADAHPFAQAEEQCMSETEARITPEAHPRGTVATRLRRLLDARRLTVNAASGAKASGVPQRTLARIVSGITRRPRADAILQLARYFRVSDKWLLTGDGEMGEGPDTAPADALHVDVGFVRWIIDRHGLRWEFLPGMEPGWTSTPQQRTGDLIREVQRLRDLLAAHGVEDA